MQATSGGTSNKRNINQKQYAKHQTPRGSTVLSQILRCRHAGVEQFAEIKPPIVSDAHSTAWELAEDGLYANITPQRSGWWYEESSARLAGRPWGDMRHWHRFGCAEKTHRQRAVSLELGRPLSSIARVSSGICTRLRSEICM